MSAVRLRRLQADYQKVQEFVNRHPRVQLIQTEGTPPERYQLQYQIRSLRQKEDRLLEVDTHLVEITLPRNYPRTPPQCRMLTPIFHPNIAPHAICIGDHWSAGEPLSSIVARIGELIAYQSYNTKSPLNGEAARWTSDHLDELPLDPVSMAIDEAGATPAAARSAERGVRSEEDLRTPRSALPTPSDEPPPLVLICPGCSGKLRMQTKFRGSAARCPRCSTVFRVPLEGESS